MVAYDEKIKPLLNDRQKILDKAKAASKAPLTEHSDNMRIFTQLERSQRNISCLVEYYAIEKRIMLLMEENTNCEF